MGHEKDTNDEHRRRADRHRIALVATGDEAAFDALYLDYHPRLARFLVNVCGRYNLVEEVINDTMMIVWEKAGDFRGDANVSTWIMSIAYRRALNMLKKLNTAWRKEQEAGEQARMDDDSPGLSANTERAQWLSLGLTQLTPDQRLAIELAYVMGYSCEEIGRVTECPVNTVKSRLFKARKKLGKVLPHLAGAPDDETEQRA